MRSAFGVEHGEIAKAALPGLSRVTRAQKATRGIGVPSRGQRLKGVLNRAGDTPITVKGLGRSTGSSIRSTGSFLEQRPGLTGTALVGGGGAAGYKLNRKKKS